MLGKPHEPRGKRKAEDAPLDDMSAQSMAQYSELMSKWSRELMRALTGTTFWVVMRIGHTLRSRLDRVHYFLKTTWPHHEPENLARMVWGKAQEYSDYLAEMCDTRHAEWTSILRPVGAAVRPPEGQIRSRGFRPNSSIT